MSAPRFTLDEAAAEFGIDLEALDDDRCHCGEPVVYGYASEDPTRHRGMCEHCDAVRCDAYPGECGR